MHQLALEFLVRETSDDRYVRLLIENMRYPEHARPGAQSRVLVKRVLTSLPAALMHEQSSACGQTPNRRERLALGAKQPGCIQGWADRSRRASDLM